MTLGEYIERLEKADPEKKVKLGLGNPDSWRGVYSELAFAPVENTTVGEMLSEARKAVGATYEGYKGGEYTMTKDTDIHVDCYGQWSDGKVLWNMLLDLIL